MRREEAKKRRARKASKLDREPKFIHPPLSSLVLFFSFFSHYEIIHLPFFPLAANAARREMPKLDLSRGRQTRRIPVKTKSVHFREEQHLVLPQSILLFGTDGEIFEIRAQFVWAMSGQETWKFRPFVFDDRLIKSGGKVRQSGKFARER